MRCPCVCMRARLSIRSLVSGPTNQLLLSFNSSHKGISKDFILCSLGETDFPFQIKANKVFYYFVILFIFSFVGRDRKKYLCPCIIHNKNDKIKFAFVGFRNGYTKDRRR